jgi:hypothetical protein
MKAKIQKGTSAIDNPILKKVHTINPLLTSRDGIVTFNVNALNSHSIFKIHEALTAIVESSNRANVLILLVFPILTSIKNFKSITTIDIT